MDLRSIGCITSAVGNRVYDAAFCHEAVRKQPFQKEKPKAFAHLPKPLFNRLEISFVKKFDHFTK